MSGYEAFGRKNPVLSEGNLPQYEVPQRIHAVSLAYHKGIGYRGVVFALAELVAVDQKPAVSVYLVRKRQIQSHKQRGPDYRVEANDLLSYHMNVRRPELPVKLVVLRSVSQSRKIIPESVYPDVNRMVGIEGYGNSPFYVLSRDRKVGKPRTNEVVEHFVHSRNGLKKFGIALVKIFQPLLIFAQPEKVTLLLFLLYLSSAVGTFSVRELTLRPEALAGRTIPAFVFGFINIALFVKLGKDLLNGFFVPLVGSPYEIVVPYSENPPKLLELADEFVRKLLGRHAFFAGVGFDFLTVFVRSRKEENLLAFHSPELSERVADYRRVTRSYMPFSAGIINGSRYIILVSVHKTSPSVLYSIIIVIYVVFIV